MLKALRKGAGLTQVMLAERAQISQRGLQDLERGIHQAPRRDTLDLLAAALGLSERDRAAFMATAQSHALASARPYSAHPESLGSRPHAADGA